MAVPLDFALPAITQKSQSHIIGALQVARGYELARPAAKIRTAGRVCTGQHECLRTKESKATYQRGNRTKRSGAALVCELYSHARTESDTVLKLKKILLDGTPACARTATEAIVMQVHVATVLDIAA